MRGYHIRIRVTAQSTSTPTKTPTTTATTGKPARATWSTDTFTPKSIFESLPSHTPRKTSKKNATLGSKRRDYRYGPIRIDWLDLKSSPPLPSSAEGPKTGTMGDAPTTSASGNGKEKGPRRRGWIDYLVSQHAELIFPLGGQVVAKFVPNPDQAKVDVGSPDQPHGSTNLPEGVVHIFRESPSRDTERDQSLTDGEARAEFGADDNTLAVLAVPSWMTPSDFLSFVEPAADGIVHLRMIRCVPGLLPSA
jgi:BRCA1-associated protein